MSKKFRIHYIFRSICCSGTSCEGRDTKSAGVCACADDVQISALDAFYEKGGRRSRYIGEELERYRGEDAGDLKRSELDELVENWTCLNAPGRTFFKQNNLKIRMDEKSWKTWKGWKTWKSNQKIVMEEELVQNGVMDEEFVQNGVMVKKDVKKL